MDWVILLAVEDKKKDIKAIDPLIDLGWYDEQLYNLLCLKTEGAALQTVKNQRENHGTRRANMWYNLTHEVAGKTGVRLERLADLVHNPKVITYKERFAQLEKQEAQRLEPEKIEVQGLPDLTKSTTLKKMLPANTI